MHTGSITGHSITTLVDAKWHRQENSLSCEIAALKMALSAQGIDIPESELISRLRFDPTPKKNGVWGDPYSGFVGQIDGRMSVTGYGVYWEPINLVANSYTRAEVIEVTPQILAQHINDGRAVVAWGYFGKGRKMSWKTSDGRTINAINGEHARTVVGFSGDIRNPEGFVVLDPIYGQQYWTTEKLFQNWAPFENKGVVVYPKPVAKSL